MTRKQLIITYAVVVFIMIWGLDLLNSVKFDLPIRWSDLFSLFTFSQLLYITSTLVLTREVFRRFFIPKRFFQLTWGILGLFMFFIFFRYLLEEVLAPALFGARNYSPSTSFQYYLLDNIYYALIYIFLGVLVFLLDNLLLTQKVQANLVRQSRDAELQFLRSQINPHFLFNTLNNIYSLVYEKSEKAPGTLLKLSELMRYMLYEKKERVPLAKEWEYLQHFIGLQKLRFEKDLVIDTLVEGDIHSSTIPTYLLIPFIENAFKHGDLKNASEPMSIRLVVTPQQLTFQVRNKIGQQHKDRHGGVGLDNVKRRLELMYPGRHLLESTSHNDWYEVNLLLKN